MGFLIQNMAATVVGLGAGFLSYQLTNATPVMVATIAACGYIGGHLPHIQQPSQPSYRIVRGASWLATLLVPLAIFLYRPTDLLPAWLVAFLFTSGSCCYPASGNSRLCLPCTGCRRVYSGLSGQQYRLYHLFAD